MSKIYAVRDAQLGFMSLFTASNDAVATRTFASAVNDKNTVMYDSPIDFGLYRLGEFNEDDGIVSSELPVIVATAISVKKEVD